MSFSLPLEALSSGMQISFNVKLPDGTLAVTMLPSTGNSTPCGTGQVLHVHASQDLDGVTLTISTDEIFVTAPEQVPFEVPPYFDYVEPSMPGDLSAGESLLEDFLQSVQSSALDCTVSPSSSTSELDQTWVPESGVEDAKAPEPPRSRWNRRNRFPCTMDANCQVNFSRKHDRLRHEVAHHGRTCDWECTACGGFFSSHATFKRHRCKPGAAKRVD
ncbi:hypothetical protein FB45DRAFT_1068975 [Roridomyces roridus]|uniref:Uncharacterized protein n=1 Tax=Roridomyces roridus TaxID=1738132 RepID=A0AAD7F8W3_9AGAR|nr:hypothetical protein FB45DRAFT_1068975 [Roridomyces roridus]